MTPGRLNSRCTAAQSGSTRRRAPERMFGRANSRSSRSSSPRSRGSGQDRPAARARSRSSATVAARDTEVGCDLKIAGRQLAGELQTKQFTDLPHGKPQGWHPLLLSVGSRGGAWWKLALRGRRHDRADDVGSHLHDEGVAGFILERWPLSVGICINADRRQRASVGGWPSETGLEQVAAAAHSLCVPGSLLLFGFGKEVAQRSRSGCALVTGGSRGAANVIEDSGGVADSGNVGSMNRSAMKCRPAVVHF